MPRANSIAIDLTSVQRLRFWSNVSGMSQADVCWLWSGRTDGFGYGHFKISTHSLKAHRVSWTLKRGPIPVGQTLDHLCRLPGCVNPAHLELVTNKENILRGTSPTAKNAAKTHCPKGHALIAPNLTRRVNGRRECRECANAARRQAASGHEVT